MEKEKYNKSEKKFIKAVYELYPESKKENKTENWGYTQIKDNKKFKEFIEKLRIKFRKLSQRTEGGLDEFFEVIDKLAEEYLKENGNRRFKNNGNKGNKR